MSAILLAVLMPYCSADDTDNASKSQTPEVGTNSMRIGCTKPTFLRMFLYGLSLPNKRWKLYVRMTYTTPGIYIKTIAFAIRDQVTRCLRTVGRWSRGIR